MEEEKEEGKKREIKRRKKRKYKVCILNVMERRYSKALHLTSTTFTPEDLTYRSLIWPESDSPFPWSVCFPPFLPLSFPFLLLPFPPHSISASNYCAPTASYPSIKTCSISTPTRWLARSAYPPARPPAHSPILPPSYHPPTHSN